MYEECVAQVAHYKLADGGGKPRLCKSDRAVDDWDDDHQAGVERQQAKIALRNRFVDQQFQQEWVSKPQDA